MILRKLERDIMPARVSVALSKLVAKIHDHPALNNEFYSIWSQRKLTIEELEIFVRNYGEWIKSFPDTLALLFLTTQDPIAKAEYAKTLYSEMGCGDPNKVHWKLFDMFIAELGEQLCETKRLERTELEKKLSLLKTTRQLIDGEKELYANKNRGIAAGAQLALEWHAYSMIAKLYEGSRVYLPLWTKSDGFHKACEYFYAHIAAAEKKHEKESLIAAAQYTKESSGFEKVVKGLNRHLDLIANFWDGIYREIKNCITNYDYRPNINSITSLCFKG